jgi:hypothetical protein
MDDSGHHGNGEVRVHPELGASVCQPSTRYARIPPGPLLKKGGSYPLEIQKRQKSSRISLTQIESSSAAYQDCTC